MPGVPHTLLTAEIPLFKISNTQHVASIIIFKYKIEYQRREACVF